MIVTVNAVGEACPLPVVKAKNAIRELRGPGTVEVLVDNEIAVQNLTRLANSQGYGVKSHRQADKRFQVTIEVQEGASEPSGDDTCLVVSAEGRKKNVVVAVSSARMGEGSDELGAVLMKGFLFALTQQDTLPATIVFYNGGAMLTMEGSAALEDLKSLEAQGVEILTCGTCLNHYGISDKLKVGEVTNMYAIVEKLLGADQVVKP